MEKKKATKRAKSSGKKTLYCCLRCLEWNVCVTKWIRGERGEPQFCCEDCSFYAECSSY